MVSCGTRCHHWCASMSNEAQAGQQFEAIWAEVKLLLEWQQGFGFFLVLGDDQRVSSRLQQRLHDFALTRTRLFQSVKPASAEQAVAEVLQAVFPTAADQRFADAKAPLWLDLMTEPDGSSWRFARQQVLGALNQRRGALERTCPRPLLLHLPLSMAGDVVTWAPDLWSIRTFVAVLPSAPGTEAFEPEFVLKRLLSLVPDLASEPESRNWRVELDAADAALSAH